MSEFRHVWVHGVVYIMSEVRVIDPYDMGIN